jgi:rubrerythrin
MENYTITEILEQAIQTEELGFRFYSQLAEKFHKNQELKSLFSRLAGQETEHKATFNRLMDESENPELVNDGWEEISHYMRAVVESEFFLGNQKTLPSMDKVLTVKDAVKLAISFEKETLLYFLGLRDVVAEQALVDKVIDEERRHIKLLAAFKHSLTD